jgi:hypothetical protein
MAGRNNGSKMVAAAVTATVAALSVSTLYLPFIADKDRIRGLNEEGTLTPAEQREYEKVMAELSVSQLENPTPKHAPSTSSMNSNSMWKRMDQAAAKK